MIKKLLFFILIFGVGQITVQGQHLLGLSNSNYAGTHGLYMNPSSIADSRTGFYLNLFSFDVYANNNYLKFSKVSQIIRDVRSQGGFSLNDNSTEILNGKPKMFNFGFDLRGPSFMLKMSPRHSLAVTTRSRGAVQGFDIAEDMVKLIKLGPEAAALQNVLNANSGFNAVTNSFAEIGLSYGRVILDKGAHFLKGGATLKRITGIYSAYLYNSDFSYTLREDASGNPFLEVDNLNVRYGYSADKPDLVSLNIFNNFSKGTWGADLGLTYEYRPKHDDYIYTMDGKTRTDGRKNKYLYKVGISLMDLGSVKYEDPSLRQYTSRRSNFNITTDDFENAEAEQYDEVIDDLLQPTKVPGTSYKSGLPTTLNVNLDYKIAGKLFMNLTWLQNLQDKEKVSMRYGSLFALTPRVEMGGFELALPLSLQNDYTTTAVGAMLRLGPLFLGSDNLKGVVFGKSEGADFYMGLSIPIMQGKKEDRDNDGVSDAKDECKTVPGTWALKGCPDSDNDGIGDKDDSCPTEAGIAAFNGCPDTDSDGIANAKDNCPTEAGLAEFGGCPDKDGDKVIDKEDSCPDLAGLSKFKGCPDKDDDGVADTEDSCPDVKGTARFKGCPDTDNDGIADAEDSCPEVKGTVALKGCPDKDADGVSDIEDKCPDQYGLVKFNGCPDEDGDGVADIDDECPGITGSVALKGCADKDKDGVADKNDRCPEVFGSISNAGCPVTPEKMVAVELSKQEAKVLKEAFDNLEFETGKNIIKESSLASLDSLAYVLNMKQEYRLLVSGHTDNVGNPATNLKLSKARAEAVKKYLIGKAVIPDKIITEGLGSKKPVASNKTPEGRQKNRRVEMKVIK